MPDFIQDMLEPSRRILLCELLDGARTVTQLVDATGMKQPNVSNHLAKLRERDIVQSSKIGRQVYYSLQGYDIEVVVRNLMIRQEEPPVVPDDEVALKIARAATAGDDESAARLIDQYMRAHRDVIKAYEDIFGAAFYYIGKWFEVQAIDVAQEHLATAILERLMSRVMHYAAVPPATGPKAILACVPENYHTIGLRMLSDCLRLHGWHTFYLGANVPLASLTTRVAEVQPDLLLLSVTTGEQLPALSEVVDALVRERARLELTTRIGVGGQGTRLPEASEVLKRVDFTANTLGEFNQLVPTLA
ncbi:MAG: metalloregulator ArsR/SmtB family transcription factor [Chthonomonas sp.]|nr:metalloregulator ArsR/SmtB family transcription factor [Chthonomonas sp.]